MAGQNHVLSRLGFHGSELLNLFKLSLDGILPPGPWTSRYKICGQMRDLKTAERGRHELTRTDTNGGGSWVVFIVFGFIVAGPLCHPASHPSGFRRIFLTADFR